MKKKTFKKINEDIFIDKLSNGIDVYLYPTKKTKNFYMSISVKYGAKVTKYKVDNKVYDIIPGSAHFLEHKVMALSENKSISQRINNLGSLANAWTSYHGTNYNLFGSIDIKENLRLLLDIFYNINIDEKCVNEEKGIIGEEIDMYKDQIDNYMYTSLYKNLFNKSYVKNTVVGEREDIEKITASHLNTIYNHYYSPNNTFIIVCGDFIPEEIIDLLNEYMKNIKLKEVEIPKRLKAKEIDKVAISYEEIKKNMKDDRVKYAIKLPKKTFGINDDVLLRYYLYIVLASNFSPTSNLYEEYRNNNIIINMGYGVNIVDDYVIITINALCSNANNFINQLEKDINKLTLTKETFERKKKLFLKAYIMDFDNIEDVEYNICTSILMEGKINFNEFSYINSMTYEEAKRILSLIDNTNSSIIRTIK